MAWVLSEGTRGHEIQSLTLADALSQHAMLTTFSMAAPWRWFLPHLLPGIGFNIKRQYSIPDKPALMISTGRQMAGVGRWLKKKQQHSVKHIHILNPGHYYHDFDVILCPEHDRINHPKVLQFRGHLHPYNAQWFTAHTNTHRDTTTNIAVFIGHPGTPYFKQQFEQDLTRIRNAFPKASVYLCGSPRLDDSIQKHIRTLIAPGESIWLNPADGENPYQNLLAHADKIFVTADSINMMNEAGASQAALSILAQGYIRSKKHLRFINSIQYRLGPVEDLDKAQPLPDPLETLLSQSNLLERLELA